MTDASAPPPPVSLVYEVREQLDGALMPTHDYAVTGLCATGTGVAPASVYAQGGPGRGFGFGAGLGARISYLVAVSPPAVGRSTWWGVRASAGLDLGLLYARVDTGLPDVSGQLCERLKDDGVAVQYRGSTVLMTQLTVGVGAQVGIGEDTAADGWHGIVLGAALVPSATYLQPWVTAGSVDGSFLGTELTLDFATMANGTAQESAKRISLFVSLPTQDGGPLFTTLSFGIVWF
jgi:hypothetical protein